MPDRTGALSSFPTSLDQFAIKKPFDSELPVSQQEFNSLEQAAHMNHMFDAIYKMEAHILGGSGGLGGSVVTRWSSGAVDSEYDVYGPNLKLGYTTLSISMTGDTISVTGLVPSAFGTNPFDSKGFTLAHNLYITNPDGAANTEGIWANKSWGDQGPFNETMRWFQFFTMIRPVSGRIYEVTVTNLPYHSTSETISPQFTDSLQPVPGMTVQNLHTRSGWAGKGLDGLYIYSPINTPGFNYWFAASEAGDNPRWGYCYPTRLGSIENSYVEFGPIANCGTTFSIGGGEAYSRFGPMVRFSGTELNASFYCIALGDVPGGTGMKYGRILKVEGCNLTDGETGEETGGGLVWVNCTKASAFHNGATSSAGNFYFGELGTRYRLKCESVTGSAKITIESATSPYSSWSTLYGPFYDGVSPLAAGYSGLFSKAMDGDSYRWMQFAGPITVENLDADTTIAGEVQLMFMLAGPEAKLTMDSGG
jgi:hypothetical protein